MVGRDVCALHTRRLGGSHLPYEALASRQQMGCSPASTGVKARHGERQSFAYYRRGSRREPKRAFGVGLMGSRKVVRLGLPNSSLGMLTQVRGMERDSCQFRTGMSQDPLIVKGKSMCQSCEKHPRNPFSPGPTPAVLLEPRCA